MYWTKVDVRTSNFPHLVSWNNTKLFGISRFQDHSMHFTLCFQEISPYVFLPFPLFFLFFQDLEVYPSSDCI